MLRARYHRITFFFGRVIASLILWDLVFPRLGLRKWSARTRPVRLQRIAARFRALAVEMGGVMIKVGQFLSTRVDVLPREITEALAELQDEVPAEAFEDIRAVAEAELGQSLGTCFLEFSQQPLAAASLGQVHRAILRKEDARKTGFREVVVKVQRPNIEQIVSTDLAALKRVAGWLQKYPPIARRADVPALLREFSRITFEEIDYLAEARNAETFADHLSSRPGVRVPGVVWSRTTQRVLVLEDVFAIKISDYEAITAAGIDRAEVAQRLFETYLQQIFEDGFFHADPHPGNLFVSAATPPKSETEAPQDADQAENGWTLTFVDFGMVGKVPPNIKAGLREMAIGIGTQDAGRVVNSYQMLGVLLPGADTELIEKAEAQLFDRFWGKSMAELQQIDLEEMQQFAREFRELVYALPFQVPNDVIFLVRCVAILSGMCTGLNPDFNVWEGLTPFAQKLISEEMAHGWEFWFEEIGSYGRLLFSLPHRLDTALNKLGRGEIALRTPELSKKINQLERSQRKIPVAILLAAFLLASVQLYLAEETPLAIACLLAALVSWLKVIFSGGE